MRHNNSPHIQRMTASPDSSCEGGSNGRNRTSTLGVSRLQCLEKYMREGVSPRTKHSDRMYMSLCMRTSDLTV